MNETVIGALGALGSIFFFGSYGIQLKASLPKLEHGELWAICLFVFLVTFPENRFRYPTPEKKLLSVFIKMPSVMAIDVDPIVFQTYKSSACFATSWLVLLYAPLKFTWWGMVGAGLWVITGVGAITAVRLAGIGPTQSLWSALSIFISYIWGAYVFKEPIRNQLLALLALIVMAAGMMGITCATSGEGSPVGQFRKSWRALLRLSTAIKAHGTSQGIPTAEDETKSLIVDTEGSLPQATQEGGRAKSDAEDRFFKGIMCAVVVGITNGSFMIPLQYANEDVVGVEYLISFGVGAVTITLCVLAIHSAVLVSYGRPLPSFHFSVIAGPALLTGLFWSAGNYCSIYATMYLGMSLGWPLVQCQLIISALWAVFYYKEVTDIKLVGGLFASSLLVVLGAAILSKFGTSKS